jgi:hypothetical protein
MRIVIDIQGAQTAGEFRGIGALYIIARNIQVFREVAGDHAFYFKGNDPEV